MKTLTAAVAAIFLLFVANVAAASCLSKIDMTKATGPVINLPAAICGASVMKTVLESATVSDTFHDADGRDMIVTHIEAIKAGKMTDAILKMQSAKLIDIEFRAHGIIAFSNAKLKKKIEQYMAETYVSLFDQPVPLRRVRISALYETNSGPNSVIYGTTIWNDKGRFGPGNRPRDWETWMLIPDLR